MQESFQSSNFCGENIHVLGGRDAVTEVDDVLRQVALANVLCPMVEQWAHHPSDHMRGDHLHAVAIGLNCCGIARAVSVERHSHRRERWSQRTRCCMRHIGPDDHRGLTEVAAHRGFAFL